jgi:hypothetical protein
MVTAMKNSTFAAVRLADATPVKPKKPATSDTRKKIRAHLSMTLPAASDVPGACEVDFFPS